MPLAGEQAGRSPRAARPARPAHAIDRRALRDRLDALVEAHGVVVVAAPAGFGKTSTLTEWAEATSHHVAWLTLSRNDRLAAHLARRVAQGVRELGFGGTAGEPPVIERGPEERPDRENLRVLVVDDSQYVVDPGPWAVLAQLIEHGPPSLRIVLVGRHEPPVGLTRLAVNGDLGILGHRELAFSTEEVRLAADTIGVPISAERAGELHSLTKGWPVVVRLALMTWHTFEPRLGAALRLASDADIPQLADYLVENVISELPASLRHFVPRACTCDWLTGRLANELGGGPNGPELLERALALGLPIERHGLWRGEPVYRWHPVMAQAGRAILLRRDPLLARELNRTAARFLAAVEPHEAALHALHGHDPELAARLIRGNWLLSVMGGETDLVEDVCAQLPAAWAEDPEILLVRAVCLALEGDGLGAAELAGQAHLAAGRLDADRRRDFELTEVLASLFLADEEGALEDACTRARELVEGVAVDGSFRACATLLLGWTQLKLRHIGLAGHLLRVATQLCQVEGLEVLADRARAYHTYTLAFAGDFVSARGRLAELSGLEPEARWRLADGAVESFTQGYVDLWSGDHDAAFDAFERAVRTVGSPTSFSYLARVGLVHAALARGNAREIAQVEALIDDLPTTTIQGMPWGIWVGVARAGILRARGEVAAALRLLDGVVEAGVSTPAMGPFVAELYWLCGRPAQARAVASTLTGEAPAYLRIGGLVVAALCDRAAGSVRSAHDALEEALELGSSLGLERPFHLPDRALLDLLVEHAARGTPHEAFLANQIAYQRTIVREYGVNPLSGREQEILGHLATTLTAGEICQALFISSNTLKTHLRSIYRKLGVDSRHDAVRAAYGAPTQVLPK